MLQVRPEKLSLLMLMASTMAGQMPARYTISGMVLNSVTNEPIRRALVAGGSSLVFTGADGRFQVANVPEGEAMLAAQKPGFFDIPSSNIRVTVQGSISDVVLKLAPEARMEGKIVDEDGEPLNNVLVTALSRRIVEGRRQLLQQGQATTDDRGRYRIDGLNAGTFVLRTAASQVNAFEGLTASGPAEQVYAPRYYPDAPDASSAQQIELRPGAREELDFKLAAAPGFHIAGSIGAGLPGMMISCENAEGESVGVPAINPKTGRFVIHGVPAGTWKLAFQYGNGEQGAYYGSETVTVTSKDIDGVTIPVQPLPNIPVIAPNSSNGRPEIGVELENIQSNVRFGIGATMLPGNLNGFTNVSPGTYRVTVPPFGDGCVDSLNSGNTDLAQDPLIVNAGSPVQPITISVRHDCASLEIATRPNSRGKTAYVVVIPAFSFYRPMMNPVDAGKPLDLTGLTPGDYSVYAFSSLDNVEYANPEALREFSGQQITLSPNQHASLTLDVNETGDH